MQSGILIGFDERRPCVFAINPSDGSSVLLAGSGNPTPRKVARGLGYERDGLAASAHFSADANDLLLLPTAHPWEAETQLLISERFQNSIRRLTLPDCLDWSKANTADPQT